MGSWDEENADYAISEVAVAVAGGLKRLLKLHQNLPLYRKYSLLLLMLPRNAHTLHVYPIGADMDADGPAHPPGCVTSTTRSTIAAILKTLEEVVSLLTLCRVLFPGTG